MREHFWKFGFIFFLSSCCGDGPWQLAGITIEYPNVTDTRDYLGIKIDSRSDYRIIDTVTIGELNEQNHHKAIFDFEEFPGDYVLYVEGTNYLDTITDTYFERTECKEKVKNLEYNLNGVLHTEYVIQITDKN